MTPFGIRRRIKSMMGMGSERAAPERPTRPRHLVSFDHPNNGETFAVEGEQGDTLVYISSNSAYPIETGCNDSTCATCQVEVVEGGDQLSPMSDQEARTLKENKVPDGYRLGCLVGPMGRGVHVRMVNVFGLDPVVDEDADAAGDAEDAEA